MRDVSFRPLRRPLLSAVGSQTAAANCMVNDNFCLDSNMRHTKFNESEDHRLIECVKLHPELYDLLHENNKNLYVKDKIWNSIASEMARDVESCKKRWKDMKDHYFKLKRKQKLEAAASVPVKKTSWLLYEPLAFLLEKSCRENETFGAVQFECVTKQEKSCFSEDEIEKNSCGSFTGSNSESFYGFNNEPLQEEISLSSSAHNNHNDSFSNQLVASRTQQQTKKRKELEVIQENTERSLQLLENLVSKKIKTESERENDDVDMFLKSVAVTLKRLPPLLVAQAKMSILSTVSMLQFSAQSFRPADQTTISDEPENNLKPCVVSSFSVSEKPST